MRIISIAALFPPHTHGGAEISASNLIHWLTMQGHQTRVLGASIENQGDITEVWRDIQVVRRNFPRPYPVHSFPKAPGWKKPLWHLQDSLDPRNRRIVGEVLDEFKPDLALVHYLPGIGYNTLAEFARRDIPAVYYMHDLGLACTRMSMFRNGHECKSQCMNCRVTASHRLKLISDFRRIGFCSPSKANLQRLKDLLPIDDYPSIAIPNANKYPPATASRVASDKLRVLYVGRLHDQKGIDVVLEAVSRLSETYPISIRVVGGGQIEGQLRARYQNEPWCAFTGHVGSPEVSNEMVNADVLVVPSIWQENLPGVAIQALSFGIPVIASDIGGIPEIVEHEQNGQLVQPGSIPAWTAALRRLFEEPQAFAHWQTQARARSSDFQQDALGRRHFEFMTRVMQSSRVRHAA